MLLATIIFVAVSVSGLGIDGVIWHLGSPFFWLPAIIISVQDSCGNIEDFQSDGLTRQVGQVTVWRGHISGNATNQASGIGSMNANAFPINYRLKDRKRMKTVPLRPFAKTKTRQR